MSIRVPHSVHYTNCIPGKISGKQSDMVHICYVAPEALLILLANGKPRTSVEGLDHFGSCACMVSCGSLGWREIEERLFGFGYG